MRSLLGQRAESELAANRIRHLDIEEVGRMRNGLVLQSFRYLLSSRGVTQQFDRRGGIQNDHRDSRILRMVSTTGSRHSTGDNF